MATSQELQWGFQNISRQSVFQRRDFTVSLDFGAGRVVKGGISR
jgi:hypothetical protein